MNIYINILIVFIIFYYIIRFTINMRGEEKQLQSNSGTPRPTQTVPPVTTFINMKTVSEGTDKKQIDTDAVAVLVKLGYNKVEATQRVVKVWDGMMETQDTVKMAIRTVM